MSICAQISNGRFAENAPRGDVKHDPMRSVKPEDGLVGVGGGDSEVMVARVVTPYLPKQCVFSICQI